ncbi:hypothetical protein LCGC14_1635230 [marine sediment metagenome]|uniref:Uncharacterized protein n=1 Tax=marine sediment metagenome TaxID=412755 RepID=A0A0F9L0V5_9ZZZZ
MAFAAGIAGGLTVSLLNSENKPNIIINNSVPLSEDQAQLYMTTPEYNRYLGIKLTNLTQYKSAEGNFKPFFWENRKTHKIRQPSREELRKYIDKLRPDFKKQHFVILRTKGIEKLPENNKNWEEIVDPQSCTDCFCCCSFICICPAFCCEAINDFRSSSPYENVPVIKRKIWSDPDMCCPPSFKRLTAIIYEPNLG